MGVGDTSEQSLILGWHAYRVTGAFAVFKGICYLRIF